MLRFNLMDQYCQTIGAADVPLRAIMTFFDADVWQERGGQIWIYALLINNYEWVQLEPVKLANFRNAFYKDGVLDREAAHACVITPRSYRVSTS